MNNKQLENNLKKYKIISIISIVIICIITILLIFLFINNKKNENFIYKLNGESESFTYYNAYFMRINNRYYLHHGEVKIKDEEKKKINSVTLKCNDNLIMGSNKFINGISEENKGYDELFPQEIVNNIDKWYFEIKYIEDEKEKTEILELNNYKIKNLQKNTKHI